MSLGELYLGTNTGVIAWFDYIMRPYFSLFGVFYPRVHGPKNILHTYIFSNCLEVAGPLLKNVLDSLFRPRDRSPPHLNTTPAPTNASSAPTLIPVADHLYKHPTTHNAASVVEQPQDVR